MLASCASSDARKPQRTDEVVTGVRNSLGLALRYDARTARLEATLHDRLAEGEVLFVRARRGKLTLDSQAALDCGELAQGDALEGEGKRELDKVVYAGPSVSEELLALEHLFDDERWLTGHVTEAQLAELALGPDPIVEACVLAGDEVRAKLQTSLAFARDQRTRDARAMRLGHVALALEGDAGTEDAGEVHEVLDAGAPVQPSDDAGAPVQPATDAGMPDAGHDEPPVERISEHDPIASQVLYGELCVQEMGEIPFFPKRADGSYETFDCRDFVASNGATAQALGVEAANIPIKNTGAPITSCDARTPLGPNDHEYDCVDKCDEGMFLEPGACQPGPTVMTAENAEGTHWVLLCRKVSDDGQGMMRTKMFNDIAMIGHNPKTGRSCYFQNSINSGRDGAHVPHPADREKSTHIWSTRVQSFCTGSCHAADPFVHSKWIDGAKRSTGKPIVPMMGQHPDFAISHLESPYNIVGADVLGFELPKQLVSDEVGACNNCHRLSGDTLDSFAEWATGTGNQYFRKITEHGKTFAEAHWMPLRLDGLTEQNWATSKYGRALAFMKKCVANPDDPSCIWEDTPRGAFDNPAVAPR